MEPENLISDCIQQRILILDGAMGTMIQRHSLKEEDYRGARFSKHPRPLKGCNEVLSLTRHELIQDIHREYLQAGADIIETNTFNATRISLKDYGLEDYAYEINAASARWARIVADEFTRLYPTLPRFVAGSIGPTGKALSISPDMNDPAARAITFNELAEVYMEQVKGLMDGGVHALLVETVFDTLNAKAALFAISRVFEETGKTVPVMLSLTISDASGRTLSGQTLEAFLVSVSHFPVFSIGLNCALGAEQMTPFLKRIRKHLPCYISAYPNAGLPNALGGYDEKPEEMDHIVQGWLASGMVNIIGAVSYTHLTLPTN
jgi:5-methyltetrahydrofolate--homocysteine methyltransferase